MDKELSAIKMHEMGVNIADIFTIDELEKFVEGFKIIIRERKSCCSRGIVVTNSNDKLLKTKVSQSSFIQRYIEGTEYTVDVICDNWGNVKLIVPRERLEIRSGITYKCRIVKQID